MKRTCLTVALLTLAWVSAADVVAAPAAAESQPSVSLDPPAGGLIAPGRAPDLFMMFTGDAVGYLETCGCKLNPAGGLARRAWVLRQLKTNYPAAPQVLFDIGNFTDNPTEAGDMRTRALLQAMSGMGYAAVNVRERDLSMGYDEFMRKTEGLPIPFISTNVVTEGTKEPVFKPWTVVETKASSGTVRIGVLGIMRFNPVWQKAGPKGTNLAVAPPVEMIRRYLPEVKAKSDFVVLLAGVSKDDAHTLVRDVPGIDYVLGAYGGIINTFEEPEGKTRIYYVGDQGKRLGEARVFLDPKHGVLSTSTFIHFLIAKYPEDPDMLATVEAAKEKIRKAVGPAAAKQAQDPADH